MGFRCHERLKCLQVLEDGDRPSKPLPIRITRFSRLNLTPLSPPHCRCPRNVFFFRLNNSLMNPIVKTRFLVADVLDSRWWVTTLSAPFTDLGWSTPCQPWSQAGKGQGLNHPFGRLLVHSIGIMFLFGIPVAAMENVPGLVEHPHWKWIHSFLRELPAPCEVTQSDLANIGYMSRSRCFLLFGADRNEKCVKDFQSQSRPDWIQANCRITDQIALEQTTYSRTGPRDVV